MSAIIAFELTVPSDLAKLEFPAGVKRRLKDLLDKQDMESGLTAPERREAEGLVDLAELLALLKLRAGGKKTVRA